MKEKNYNIVGIIFLIIEKILTIEEPISKNYIPEMLIFLHFIQISSYIFNLNDFSKNFKDLSFEKILNTMKISYFYSNNENYYKGIVIAGKIIIFLLKD